MDCDRCRYSKAVPGGYHACHHPAIATERAILLAIPAALEGLADLGGVLRAFEGIGITLNQEGVRQGEAVFPVRYKPAHVVSCRYFAAPGYTTLGYGFRGTLTVMRLKGDWDAHAQPIRDLATHLLLRGWTAGEIAAEIERMSAVVVPPIKVEFRQSNTVKVLGQVGEYEFTRPSQPNRRKR